MQDKFFPAQAHLASPERDERAVRALIYEHELARALLDFRMLPRGHSIDDDDRIVRSPPEPNSLFHHDLAPAVGKPDGWLASGRWSAQAAGDQRALGARLPHDLVNVDLQDLSLDRHRREPARHFAGMVRHGFHGFARRHHLPGKRDTGHARSHVHGVAENIVAFLYHRTVVEAYADLELYLAFTQTLQDLRLHFARRFRSRVRGREYAHRAIADRLHDAPVVRRRNLREQGEALAHLPERGGVSQRLVQVRAVAHICEQHGHAVFLMHHASLETPPEGIHAKSSRRRLCRREFQVSLAARGIASRDPAEYRPRHEAGTERVVVMEEPAYHLTAGIEPRDGLPIGRNYLRVLVYLQPPESECDTAGHGIGDEGRRVEFQRPVGLSGLYAIGMHPVEHCWIERPAMTRRIVVLLERPQRLCLIHLQLLHQSLERIGLERFARRVAGLEQV